MTGNPSRLAQQKSEAAAAHEVHVGLRAASNLYTLSLEGQQLYQPVVHLLRRRRRGLASKLARLHRVRCQERIDLRPAQAQQSMAWFAGEAGLGRHSARLQRLVASLPSSFPSLPSTGEAAARPRTCWTPMEHVRAMDLSGSYALKNSRWQSRYTFTCSNGCSPREDARAFACERSKNEEERLCW